MSFGLTIQAVQALSVARHLSDTYLERLVKNMFMYKALVLALTMSVSLLVHAQTTPVSVASTVLDTQSTPVESEPCVLARNVRNIDIVTNELLVLRGTAKRWWVSRLPNKCAGLRDRMYLTIDRYGSKICRNDRFEAREHGGGFYTSCRFGAFEPVTEGSVEAIKVAALSQ